MNKRILSIMMALVLMLTLTTTAFAEDIDNSETASEPTTETTFNRTISISNVIKRSELYAFDRDGVNAALEVDEKHYSYNPNDDVLLYCSGAPVTITFHEADSEGDYGIKSYVYYYIDDASAPTVAMTKYDVTVYDSELDEDVAKKAFSGTITLTKPGTYYLYVTNRSTDIELFDCGFYFVVGDDSATTPPPAPLPATANAVPTSSKVYVNGTLTEFEAYGINGNNYFKLRDLAKVVDGTAKNFEVTWDGEKKSINLVSNKGYTEVGGELAKGDGKEKAATLNTSTIYKDGEMVQLTAYTIGGNNYFKLRDVAQAFNIGVTWDGVTSTIGIDTAIDYVP